MPYLITPFLSTAEGLQALIQYKYYPNVSSTDMDTLINERYPDDPELGVPYGTGDNYQHEKGWKRFASIFGDIGTDSVRRKFVRTHTSLGYDTWSYSKWRPLHSKEIAHKLACTSSHSLSPEQYHGPRMRQ